MGAILLEALRGRNTGRPPLWLMRQAGRYLPEYQLAKGKRKLFDLFHDPEKIIEITQLPLSILGVDAAILFSDILTVLDGLNLRYDFQEGVGPVVFDDHTQAQLLPAQAAYTPITTAIRTLKRTLPVPLIGFAGGPFTVASYILDKKSTRDLKATKKWLYTDPKAFNTFITLVTAATLDYLKEQIHAGVDALQIFESWGSALSIFDFRTYCLAPLRALVEGLRPYNIPILLFSRGSALVAQELATLAPAALSIDWNADMGALRTALPSSIGLQGNLDPMLLYGAPAEIARGAARILESMRGHPGFIFNLGHGLLPDTPVSNVKFLVDYVRNYR